MLDNYVSPAELPEYLQPDEQGSYRLGDRRFVRLDERFYELQEQPQGQRHLIHPDDPRAYRPRLVGNGAGAWRTIHEHPMDWSDIQLIRRLGPICDGLEDADLDAAMRGTGTDGDILRHTHVAAARPPALLADALEQLRCDRQADDIVDRIRNAKPIAAYRNYALPSLPELSGWPRNYAIKAFHGPEATGEFTLYGRLSGTEQVEIEITLGELETGRLSQVILEQIDEQAARQLLPADTLPADRAQALNDKLADHLASNRDSLLHSLYSGHRRPLNAEGRVLAGQFRGLPDRAVEELLAHASPAERQRIGTGRVPLRIAEEARVMQARARLDRAILGLYRPSLANADSQRLLQALHNEYPGADRAQLLEVAFADRRHATTLIGQQPIRPGYRSPLRLAEGRLGYPLSGRPRLPDWLRLPGRATLDRRLQDLYPSLTARQRETLLVDMRRRGDVGSQITALQRERDILDNTLAGWANTAQDAEREGRESIRQMLNGAWRQDTGEILELEGVNVDELPELPARFDHITTLQIRNIGIRRIPDNFFQSFPRLRTLRIAWSAQLDFEALFQALRNAPRLRTLELGNNELESLSEAARNIISNLRELRRLNLRRNRLRLGSADVQALAAIPLESLNLEHNMITLDASMAEHLSRMSRLRDLSLTFNPLEQMPDLTNLTSLQSLQVRDCNLQSWPQGLTSLMSRPNYQLRFLDISDNPITEIPELEQVLASPYVRDLPTLARSRLWIFNDSELADQAIQRLRNAGVSIEWEDALPADEGVDWLATANDSQRRLWYDFFPNQQTNPHLQSVFQRLGRSAQAQADQRGLASQIWQLLEQTAGDKELRARLEKVASSFPPTCGDAGTDAFSTLEVEVLAHAEMAENPDRGPYLFNFYRRLFRREQVNALAERIQVARSERQAVLLDWELHPRNAGHDPLDLPPLDVLDDIRDDDLLNGGVDLIEIRLALRQALAETLEFPEPSRQMLYREMALVSGTTVGHVEDAVWAADRSINRRRAWVARQPSWRSFLEQHFANRFTELDERWYEGLDYLEYCLDESAAPVTMLDADVRRVLNEALPQLPLDPTSPIPRIELNSQQFGQANERVNAARQAAHEALFDQLTIELDPNN